MDLWEQVILEWVNCLGILKEPVKDIQTLHNTNFYTEVFDKLSWEGHKDITVEGDTLSFIKDEYPNFQATFHGKHEKFEEIQVASLLLLHIAHKPTFHSLMCTKLQHETQVKIKSFLEMLLPYGKHVTKEILLEVINELEGAPQIDLNVTPRTKPLKEFFNSPAARSIHSQRIMTEHMRQLRQLKSELETERFEKMDLQEDVRIQKITIQDLEKMLEEKTAQLKALSAEHMRATTPQSCKKSKSIQYSEDYYKREMEHLENELLRTQAEVEKYAEENNNLIKKISLLEKQYIDIREAYSQCEKSLGMIKEQVKLKEKDIIDLSMNNEELREHLREITRRSVEEPSFEGESLLRPLSPSFYPTTERLSSVIDIQLQEAKGESALLKTQINFLNEKLQGLSTDHQEALKQNAILQEKAKSLEVAQQELKSIQNEMHKIQDMETEKRKFNDCLDFLLKAREPLKQRIAEIMILRNTVETALSVLKEKWHSALNKFKHIFIIDSSMCDELKHLQVKKEELTNVIHSYEIVHLENLKPLSETLWQTFLWTEQKLESIDLQLVKCPENEGDTEHNGGKNLLDEQEMIELEHRKNETLHMNILQCEKEIDIYMALATAYENNVNAGQIKKELNTEGRLKLQVEQLLKEKKDLKFKLENVRIRNAKLEKNLDELRGELKKVKADNSSSNFCALEDANKKIKQLEDKILLLEQEKGELSKRPKEEDVDSRLTEVHNKYALVVEDMKQKMKSAYNEQVAKMNKQQGTVVQEKMDEMKQLCRKHAEEIKRYKEHVGQLTKQLWSVGEKLLIIQKEKEGATHQLEELKVKLQYAKRESDKQRIAMARNCTQITEEAKTSIDSISRQCARTSNSSTHAEKMYEKRRSMRSMQALSNAFNAEDEEGEVFDSRYIADMKEGRCLPSTHLDRLSILQMRNSLCKPHLKSSYPAETQFHPLGFSEEDIKNHSNMIQTGTGTEDVFNDSLTQSLLAEQKPKKRERTQTSYKKPGPPTPCKNGGRLSLQGNELRSPNSRILKDRNVERRTTITPRRLKDIFSTSTSKRQDENLTATPKGRRLSSIFRKPRAATERL